CTCILHGLEVRDRTSAPSPSTLSISPDILSIELDPVLRCNVARCSHCNILCDTRANIAGESDPRRPTINRTLNGLEVLDPGIVPRQAVHHIRTCRRVLNCSEVQWIHDINVRSLTCCDDQQGAAQESCSPQR